LLVHASLLAKILEFYASYIAASLRATRLLFCTAIAIIPNWQRYPRFSSAGCEEFQSEMPANLASLALVISHIRCSAISIFVKLGQPTNSFFCIESNFGSEDAPA
jgi:hypothetical protein